MPSSKAAKKLSPEQKRIAELEKQVLDQGQTIGKLEKKLESKDVAIRDLIPKPPGQAGRKGGYSLKKEVQLPEERYARILRIVRAMAGQGLDPHKSFREQDKARIKAVVTKVMTNVPVLKHYQGYWPILAIIKQYLGNAKKRLVRDLKAEQEDPGLPGPSTNSNGHRKIKNRKRKVSAKESEAEASDKELDSPDEVENESTLGSEEDEEDDRAEMELYEQYVKGSGPSNERQSKKLSVKRPATTQTPNTERITKRARTDQTTRAAKVRCPEDDCIDVLQAPLSERLGSMFEHLSNIRNGKEKGTPLVQSLLICQAIKEELRFPMLKELGVRSGWPTAIDFEGIPAQIMELKDEIRSLLKNEIVLGTSFTWSIFVNDITNKHDMSLADFAASNEATRLSVAGMGDNRHAGYYGPMGESVILSTLNRVFPDPSSDTNELASTLQSLYENEMVECEQGDLLQRFWEGTKTNPCPITLRDFLTYLVVPETAVLLIAKGLGVTNAQANNIRVKSKEYGKAFFSTTDDGRIDDITNANVQALRAELPGGQFPPRMKRKVAALAPVENPRILGSILNNQSLPAVVANLSREDHASRPIVAQSATPGPGPKTAAKRPAKLRIAAPTKSAAASARRSDRKLNK